MFGDVISVGVFIVIALLGMIDLKHEFNLVAVQRSSLFPNQSV
jgi:hypothetical protein